jgi:F0F1-type ATP synthase membrane subunit c/vacuolar-type H+-ATPase subunit K
LMTAVVEKPESYTTNILGVVLSEALAIYGLLIAFMLIA